MSGKADHGPGAHGQHQAEGVGGILVDLNLRKQQEAQRLEVMSSELFSALCDHFSVCDFALEQDRHVIHTHVKVGKMWSILNAGSGENDAQGLFP